MKATVLFLILPLMPIAGVILALVFRRLLRGSRARARTPADRSAPDPVCRRCGYNMTGLNFPRCPECGTLRGFDVPIDTLPLTDDERQVIDARCRGQDAK